MEIVKYLSTSSDKKFEYYSTRVCKCLSVWDLALYWIHKVSWVFEECENKKLFHYSSLLLLPRLNANSDNCFSLLLVLLFLPSLNNLKITFRYFCGL